jgi:ferric-dicitrate binding protein FerR (iron transport regulator)
MTNANRENPAHRDDPTWQTAWNWVLREHERPLNAAEQSELVQWLKADPAHYKNYEEASRIWLLSALVPPESGTSD